MIFKPVAKHFIENSGGVFPAYLYILDDWYIIFFEIPDNENKYVRGKQIKRPLTTISETEILFLGFNFPCWAGTVRWMKSIFKYSQGSDESAISMP